MTRLPGDSVRDLIPAIYAFVLEYNLFRREQNDKGLPGEIALQNVNHKKKYKLSDEAHPGIWMQNRLAEVIRARTTSDHTRC